MICECELSEKFSDYSKAERLHYIDNWKVWCAEYVENWEVAEVLSHFAQI